MDSGSILCEIASLKMRTVAMLKSAEKHGIKPLSVHPMFGPDIEKMEGQTIAIVPVSNRDDEASLAGALFPNTRIVIIDPETHDRCMASILSLPYFMNLAFARALSSGEMTVLRQLAGTTFTVQLAVAQSIVGESPELTESLINENMFSKDLVNHFIEEARYIRRLLKNRPQEIERLCDELKDTMMKDPGYLNARKLRNTLSDSMKV